MTSSSLPEVVCAVPTVFDRKGDIDFPAVARIIDRARGNGIDQFFLGGTNGEFPNLRSGERVAVFETGLEHAGADAVIAHVGAPDARAAVGLAEAALARGVRRFAAITPYFFDVPFAGVVDYYRALRDAVGDSEVHLYLFPARTGVSLRPEEVAEVATRASLNGVKASGAEIDYIEELRSVLPPEMAVYSGDDSVLSEVAALGGQGVVSGVSSAVPQIFAALQRVVAAGPAAAVSSPEALHVDEAVRTLGGQISSLKYALQCAGVIADGRCRAPIMAPGESQRRRIEAFMATVEADAFAEGA